MKSDDEWARAIDHARQGLRNYVEIIGEPQAMVSFAIANIERLLRRYNRGERSDELYSEMLGIE